MADLSLQIGVGVTELKSDLDKSAKAVADTANQMGKSLKDLGGASENASRGFSRLTAILNEERKDATAQARQVGFITKEITELIPAASGAKGAISGLTAVFLEGATAGFGIGLAMEAVKLAVTLLGAEFAETEKAQAAFLESSRKTADDIAKAYSQSAQSVLKSQYLLAGGKASDFDAANSPMEALSQYNALKAELGRMEVELERRDEMTGGAAKDAERERLVANIETQRKLVAQAKELHAIKVADAELSTKVEKQEASKGAAKSAAASRIQEQKELAGIIFNIRKSLASDLEKLDLEYEKEKAHIASLAESKEGERKQALLLLEQKYLRDRKKLQDDALKEDMERASKLYEVFDKERTASLKKQEAQYQQVAGTIAGSLTDILMGQRSFADGMKSMIESMIRDLIRLAIQMAIVKALMPAGAGGLTGYINALTSGNLGPVGDFASVVNGLPSAAGGWDIGPVNPGLSQLHANEMVLPAHLADRVRNMTEPSQAVNVTLAVSAMDGKSVESFFKANEKQLVRTLGNAVRNGRA